LSSTPQTTLYVKDIVSANVNSFLLPVKFYDWRKPKFDHLEVSERKESNYYKEIAAGSSNMQMKILPSYCPTLY
jgi:hypothetical protein